MKKSKAPPKRSLDGPPAKAAMARRLAIQMFWMWRKGWDYEQVRKFGSHAGQPGHRDGVQSNTE